MFKSDTKIDSSQLVSNSLIQVGRVDISSFRPTIRLFIDRPSIGLLFILCGKHMAKYNIHIMESLPGVFGNREMIFNSGEQGTKVKF